jgi:Site-specific recombinase XerD
MPKKIEKRGNNSFRLTVYSGYDDQGRQKIYTKTISATNAKEAKIKYQKFEAECQGINPKNPANFTLDNLYDLWTENYSKTNHELTTQSYYRHLYKKISIILGDKMIRNIKPLHILETQKKLIISGLSPSSVQKYQKFIKLLFSKAVQWEFITSNPCDKIDLPKKSTKVPEIYDEKTLKEFLVAVENEPLKYKLMTYLGLVGGLRRGEIFGLEWDKINWEKKYIKIDQSAPYISKQPGYLKKPKTDSSIRTISLPESVMAMLKQQKQAQQEKATLLENQWHQTNRIFTQWNGLPGNPCSFRNWLIKLADKHDLPRISPHTLRHLSATYLINLGVDVKTVSSRLGHSRTSTTTDIYSHFLKKSEEESAQKIGDFMDTIKNQR